MNEQALFKLTYGLFVLTVKNKEKDNGCIINTVMQVTDRPNRIAIAVNKRNYTHECLIQTKKCNVSILSEEADFRLFQRFGFVSGRDKDKFADYTCMKRSSNGLYYITEGSNAYISATVRDMVDLDTHTLFIADVEDMEVLNDKPAVTYAYYHAHIKPKPQEKPKSETKETVWRCRICGYEYIGETLPEDYICPVCKHPASDFEKVE